MDTIASLLTDTMIDKLIDKYAKFRKGQKVYCKTNHKNAIVTNVSYDIKTDNIGYDIRCNGHEFHSVPEHILTTFG